MSMHAVIDLAMAELGNTEFPAGSNKCKYNTDYYGWEVSGDAYKWCLVLLWWLFNRAGERMAFFGGGKTASCGTLLRWYREQGLTVPVSEIQPGDIVILNFSGKMGADGKLDTEHCGLVLGVNSTDDRYINTVEGNTTPGDEGSQDNGGCVALKHRLRRQVVGVCRPQYKPEEPKKDYEGHWAENNIRWGIENGLLTGYPDGSYRPNEPITRAEAITMLRRYSRLGDDGK